jgi:hypothetical protein
MGKETNMKNRTAAFLLALCLVSSLSFADNPTDAPLVVSDAYAALQPSQGASAVKRHGDKKKDKACPPQTAQSAVKSQEQKAQQHPQTDMSPTM